MPHSASALVPFALLCVLGCDVRRTTATDSDTTLARDAQSVSRDEMSPLGRFGYQLLETIRGESRDMPELILSARSDEVEKVRGFRVGADDYVTKPVGLQELLARIEALLRRHVRVPGTELVDAHVCIGALTIDAASRTATMHGHPVVLRPKEFDLLWAIARRGGKVATRRDLLLEVWGYASGVVSRTIDTHVVEVRRKLGVPPEAPEFILTVRKAGYRLAVQKQ